MAFPIPSTALSGVAPRLWSLRLLYQLPGGPIGQSVHVDGVWSQEAPAFKAVPLSPLASITYDGGKEIRVYYLDYDYIIQEYCHSQGKGWYLGEIGKLKVKATPLSRLSALVYSDGEGRHIRVYYQEDKSHVVAELCHDKIWHTGQMRIKDAVEGTGIAAVTYAGNGYVQIRVYYQTFEELYLKEYCHNNKGWFPGQFAPGKAPLGTTISAIASDNAQIQVFWRGFDNHVAHAKHTGRWNSPKVIKEAGPGFQFTLLSWEAGKRLRLFYEDYNNFLFEVCSDDGGETWFQGKKLTGTN